MVRGDTVRRFLRSLAREIPTCVPPRLNFLRNINPLDASSATFSGGMKSMCEYFFKADILALYRNQKILHKITIHLFSHSYRRADY